MNRKLQHMRPALVNRKCPILLHSNARAQVALMKLQKLNKLGYETLSHPPYLSPAEYYFLSASTISWEIKSSTTTSAVENAFREFIDSRTLEF
ncbi:Histone-lysine N-methyltransferase SETMAR [Araneus ventricosus]|uniref:Histone-lysine N-methyltransferase SETMAR n=1 Tax=Araneus ventricosus TaxID=182803 RepID=A0A4Y2SJY6_ARAVE|nr:Histone-lysine N-methyltransferase SETMAR [Araneus ventricosus]